MSIDSIYRDESLIGHALQTSPYRLWDFATGEFCLQDSPDTGTYVVERDYLIAKQVHYRKGNTLIFRTELLTEGPLLAIIEFVARRILGSLATIFSFVTLLPIGFVTKLLHAGARQLNNPSVSI